MSQAQKSVSVIAALVGIGTALVGAVIYVAVPSAVNARDIKDLQEYKRDHTAFADAKLKEIHDADNAQTRAINQVRDSVRDLAHKFDLFLVSTGHQDIVKQTAASASLRTDGP